MPGEFRNPYDSAASIDAAKRVILTGDTEKRWANTVREVNGFISYMPFAADVLDFGCGIGRISKAILSEHDECCAINIVGVDSSETMREMAVEYVNHPNFKVFPNYQMRNGSKYDFGILSLVLQHMTLDDCAKTIVEFKIRDIPFVYINNLQKRRLWSSELGLYVDDGKQEQLMSLINGNFRLIHSLPAEPCHFAGVYKTRF